MTPEYLALAGQRTQVKWPPYKQPEDFGYDFHKWVSPYTKTAHATGGIAIVLQDWASADRLSEGVEPVIQEYGRFPRLLTNRRLDALVHAVFGLSIHEVYVTNAFPFVKPGGMSAPIPLRDMVEAVERFTIAEIEIAQPERVLALGAAVAKSLERAGVDAVDLPHPAARGMGLDAHISVWRRTIETT